MFLWLAIIGSRVGFPAGTEPVCVEFVCSPRVCAASLQVLQLPLPLATLQRIMFIPFFYNLDLYHFYIAVYVCTQLVF